ncbi:hypothetical protein [Burkholderia sp. Bp9031]|uniref:hypothetical protein n=1 Tax=Burkholderia sp. Bp9031 TaxID=2184566 RepID=UPI000F5D8E53|nr:hypothetical protein [Burkholderia sp. Bp9031]
MFDAMPEEIRDRRIAMPVCGNRGQATDAFLHPPNEKSKRTCKRAPRKHGTRRTDATATPSTRVARPGLRTPSRGYASCGGLKARATVAGAMQGHDEDLYP